MDASLDIFLVWIGYVPMSAFVFGVSALDVELEGDIANRRFIPRIICALPCMLLLKACRVHTYSQNPSSEGDTIQE